MSLQSKSIHIVLRAAPSFWASVEAAIAESGDSTILLCQGQAKTYKSSGGTNPSIFAQQDWDDHPGPHPTNEQKIAIERALKDPEYTVHVHNSFAGEHANDRARAGEFILNHLNEVYKKQGGFKTLVYHTHYDVDGRNDKIHITEYLGEGGQYIKISENNAPGGVYAPIIYKRSGVDYITMFDPHSYLNRQNNTKVFGDDHVAFLSGLKALALSIVKTHRSSILNGTFKIGAPDGWDKKDDPNRNLATQRAKDVCHIIWDSVAELSCMYGSAENFIDNVQFGVTKVRRAKSKGAPANPEVTNIYGAVDGCDCIIIDDLADSGASVTQTGTALIGKGAKSIHGAVCHGPAQESAFEHLLTFTHPNDETRIVVDSFTTTNTMPRVEEFIDKLPAEQRARVTMINCGDIMVEFLQNFRPKPPAPAMFFRHGSFPPTPRVG